jgi:hypothetical protein
MRVDEAVLKRTRGIALGIFGLEREKQFLTANER